MRRWDGPLETVGWEEFVARRRRRPTRSPTRSDVTLEDLRDREWVLYHPDHGLAGVVEEICRRAGFRPRGTVRTSQAEGAVRLAAVGVGIALVPDNIVAPGSTAPCCGFAPRLIRDIAVYARSDWSPTAAAFVDVLRSNHARAPAKRAL